MNETNLYYRLEGHDPVPCDNLTEWSRSMRHVSRTVAVTQVGDVRVSTVFLGVNHAFGGGRPLVFESMVFGGPMDQEQKRYSTWNEALSGHKALVAEVLDDRVLDKPRYFGQLP